MEEPAKEVVADGDNVVSLWPWSEEEVDAAIVAVQSAL